MTSLHVWEQSLLQHLLLQAQARFHVCVTRECLDVEFAGSGGAATLVEQVRDNLDFSQQNSLFVNFIQELNGSNSLGELEHPPVLTVLVLTVLAAMEMESDKEFSKKAYYARLAMILGNGASDEDFDHLVLSLNRSFGDVVTMWQRFAIWLEAEGFTHTIGISHFPHLRKIGYPLSQAWIRESDKSLLTRFWASVGVATDVGLNNLVPDPNQLLQSLKIWAPRHRLNPVLREAMHAEPDKFSAVLHSIARGWDGIERNEIGKRLGQLQLVGLEKSGKFRFEWRLLASDGSHEYERQSLRLTDLRNGLTRSHPEVNWEVSPRGVYVFTKLDAFSDEYQVSGLIAGVRRMILVYDPNYRDAIRAFSQEVVSPRSLSQRRVFDQDGYKYAVLPDVTEDLVILRGALERLSTASNSNLVNDLQRDLTRRNVRVRLTEGLHIPSKLNSNLFLQGGEPNLHYPASDEIAGSVEVRFDGLGAQTLQRPGPLPLRCLSWRQEEEEIVGDVDGSKFTFTRLHIDKALRLPNMSERDFERWPTSQFGYTYALYGCDQTYLLGPQFHIRRVDDPPSTGLQLDLEFYPDSYGIRCLSREQYLVQRNGDKWSCAEVFRPTGDHPPFQSETSRDMNLWQHISREVQRSDCQIPAGLRALMADSEIES